MYSISEESCPNCSNIMNTTFNEPSQYPYFFPKTFIWIPKTATSCCNSIIAVYVINGTRGPVISLDDINICISHYHNIKIFNESKIFQECEHMRCMNELKQNAFAKQFSSMALDK
jgi:hypothetical protein